MSLSLPLALSRAFSNLQLVKIFMHVLLLLQWCTTPLNTLLSFVNSQISYFGVGAKQSAFYMGNSCRVSGKNSGLGVGEREREREREIDANEAEKARLGMAGWNEKKINNFSYCVHFFIIL